MNKNTTIIGAGLVILIVAGGAWFWLSGENQKESLKKEKELSPDPVVSLSHKKNDEKPIEMISKESQGNPEIEKWLAELEAILIKPDQENLDHVAARNRLEQLKQFLRGLNPDNLESVIALYEELGGFQQESVREQGYLLMEAWSRFDPEGALDFSLDEIKEDYGAQAALTVLRNWDGENIQLATSRVSKIGEFYYHEFLGEVAKKQLKKNGVQSTLNWLRQIEDEEIKGVAITQITEKWAELDPQAAAAWLMREVEWDKSGDAPKQVMEKWIQVEPETAMEWGESLPEGDKRKQIMARGIIFWANEDPAAAGEYLNQFTSGEGVDDMVFEYARVVADQNPVAALSWAQSVQSESIRSTAIDQVISAWVQRDQEGLKKWMEGEGMEKNELDESMVKRINLAIEQFNHPY